MHVGAAAAGASAGGAGTAGTAYIDAILVGKGGAHGRNAPSSAAIGICRRPRAGKQAVQSLERTIPGGWRAIEGRAVHFHNENVRGSLIDAMGTVCGQASANGSGLRGGGDAGLAGAYLDADVQGRGKMDPERPGHAGN